MSESKVYPVPQDFAAEAHINTEQYAAMSEVAKTHDVHIKLRPRPPESIKWSDMGYNAKPPPVKQKSISDISPKRIAGDAATPGMISMTPVSRRWMHWA